MKIIGLISFTFFQLRFLVLELPSHSSGHLLSSVGVALHLGLAALWHGLIVIMPEDGRKS
jgi:hypothetical protein